jgi:hypothetical protein
VSLVCHGRSPGRGGLDREFSRAADYARLRKLGPAAAPNGRSRQLERYKFGSRCVVAMSDREALIVLRDHGLQAGEQRFDAVLAGEHEIAESGPTAWTALGRLVTANADAVDWALLIGRCPSPGALRRGARRR